MIAVADQFAAALDTVAFIDRSTIGRIEVSGRDAIDLLHRLSTQNLLQRKAGDVVGTVFTTDKGRIVDYVYIMYRGESLLLLTSPTNEQAFKSWIDKFTIMEDITLTVLTSSTGIISLLGPNAKALAEHVFGVSIQVNRFVDIRIGENAVTLVCREEFQTQFLDMIFDLDAAKEIKTMLMAGEYEFGLREMNKHAFDMFRISRGIPSLGYELSCSFNPYEVNLAHAISFTKGCYLGQEVIARLDTYQKIQNEIFGIVFTADDFPTAGSPVYRDDLEAGVLTSVSVETLQEKRIGLGVLKKKLVKADDNISVISGDKTFKGMIRRIPFVP